MTPGSAWFGHPSFLLSRPRSGADVGLTHAPSTVRRANRWFWELGKVAFPAMTAAVSVAMALAWLRASAVWSPPAMAWIVTPAIGLSGPFVLAVVVLALKWGLLGRVRPGEHGLWSCWCSRWDYFYVGWDRLARPFLSRFEGTLLLTWYLRAMGMRIGRRVLLGPGFAQVVDPDMIAIDDDATVHALFQAHTFEDRMLKIDRVHIGRGATVACGAVVFYGAHIGDGARVAPQSVIMKRERLAEGGRYEGVPSIPLSGPDLAGQEA
jgi:non-ribosomal peptide synthetase-like protein